MPANREPLKDAHGMDATRDDAAEVACRGGGHVHVEILRIPDLRELEDLGLGDAVGIEVESISRGEIAAEDHGSLPPSGVVLLGSALLGQLRISDEPIGRPIRWFVPVARIV